MELFTIVISVFFSSAALAGATLKMLHSEKNSIVSLISTNKDEIREVKQELKAENLRGSGADDLINREIKDLGEGIGLINDNIGMMHQKVDKLFEESNKKFQSLESSIAFNRKVIGKVATSEKPMKTEEVLDLIVSNHAITNNEQF